MNRDRCRPFGVLDAMILVGFMAVGLAGPRAMFPQLRWDYFSDAYREADFLDGFLVALELCVVLGTPVLAALALAVVTIRLRRPRPPLRRALRSSGVLGCGWIVLGFITSFACILGMVMMIGLLPDGPLSISSDLHENSNVALMVGQPVSAFGILASWGTSALFRRPRPCCSTPWIDRLGLAVSGAWILMTPVHVLFLLAYT